MFMPSTIGRSPVMAAPMPIPMNPFSVPHSTHSCQDFPTPTLDEPRTV